MKDIQSVSADMQAHTVTVTFDDEEVSMQEVLGALNDAGYTVPDYRRLEADG